MFIIFDKANKTIYSYGQGNPTESGNKLKLGAETICNDLTICGWKYIDNQRLEQDESGFVHDADYYEAVTPAPSLQDQIDAILELL